MAHMPKTSEIGLAHLQDASTTNAFIPWPSGKSPQRPDRERIYDPEAETHAVNRPE